MKKLILILTLTLPGCSGSAVYYSGGINTSGNGDNGLQGEVGMLYKNIKVGMEKEIVLNGDRPNNLKIKVDYIGKVNF